MKKTRKISVLALFALSFALVLGGCKNSTSGASQNGELDDDDDITVPVDPNAPKTKFTNAAWTATPSAAYGNLIINLADLDIDPSDYDYIKINAKFLDSQGEEILYSYPNSPTGQAVLDNGEKYGTDKYKSLSVQNMNAISSEFGSAYIPIQSIDFEPKQINVQNAGTNVASYTVNYVEFVKIEGLKKAVKADITSILSAVEAEKNGEKVVFALAYGDGLTPGWGVGAVQYEDKDENKNTNIEFVSSSDAKKGMTVEFDFSLSEFKAETQNREVSLNCWGGGALQYVYIK